MEVFETEGEGSNPSPETKLCTLCKLVPSNGYNSRCKSCHNEYMKSYYKINKLHSTPSFIKRRKEKRDYIIACKDVSCVDCGIKYPSYVMDFDHLRDKEFDISAWGNKAGSMDRLKKEIDKCEVVCSNCHRERTFNR